MQYWGCNLFSHRVLHSLFNTPKVGVWDPTPVSFRVGRGSGRVLSARSQKSMQNGKIGGARNNDATSMMNFVTAH
jgi:hypothetical protein